MQRKRLIYFGLLMLFIIIVMVSCGKNTLSENKILNDQEVLDELANGIGTGYEIELIDIYDRKTDDNDDFVYCNFEAQNEKIKIVGQVCIVYHRYEQGWSMTNYRAVSQDSWEIVPLQGVSEETIFEDVKYASEAKGELQIIDRDTDLENLRDTIFVQETSIINQLKIMNTYEVVYGFYQDRMWQQMNWTGSGDWCVLIEQKIDIDISGEWIGYDNGEYYYVNILECGEDRNISAEFSFPFDRWFQSTIQVAGIASGTLDLSGKYPKYYLQVESEEGGTSYLSHFWISFDPDKVNSDTQIFITTGQGNTCTLNRSGQSVSKEETSGSFSNQEDIFHFRITYQVVGDGVPSSADMSDTIAKIQQRAKDYGVEAVVYQEGVDQISLEISSNTTAGLSELVQSGTLYFIAQTDSEGNENFSWQMVQDSDGNMVYECVLVKTVDEMLADGSIVLSGGDIQDAQAVSIEDAIGTRYVVMLTMTEEGTTKFAEATVSALIKGESLGIYYNGSIISAPVVSAVITDGHAQITCYSYEDAERMASNIRIGALKLELEEVVF